VSPVIRISDETFEKLQSLAKPFVDTPDSVISRLVEAAVTSAPAQHANGTPSRPDDGVLLDPESPDDLTHTRLRRAEFAGRLVEPPNWNNLLRTAHAVALEELGSIAALRQASGANVRDGRYENEGFTYVADARISVQGADANKSWQHSMRLARKLGVPIEVQFEWQSKDTAAHPGKRGKIKWSPRS
jgi:hypothetical protein